MSEDFLHYCWRYRLFRAPVLATTSGDLVEVIFPGHPNRHAGPDFLDARLRIGGVQWAGHVEIHIQASDWLRHGHSGDPRYDGVVLHAVHTADVEVTGNNGLLPAIALEEWLLPGQWEKYQRWLSAPEWIPCARSLSGVDEVTWVAWQERLAVERLEMKVADFREVLLAVKNDWDEAIYRWMARNYGFRVNAAAMERMAEGLPFALLMRHRDRPDQVEALLFGQLGLLHGAFSEEYPRHLQREYQFLAAKYGLVAQPPGSINTGRVRPSGSPWLRVAQFAAMVIRYPHLRNALLEVEMNGLMDLFGAEPHAYWQHHFRFDDPRSERELRTGMPHRMGRAGVENLLVNTVAVVNAAYGSLRGEEKFVDRAVKMLEVCRAEDNYLVAQWAAVGIRVPHAAGTQALLQLYTAYCRNKRCLSCAIGQRVLRPDRHAEPHP